MQRKLQIVGDAQHTEQVSIEKGAVERLFDHWVFMMGKNPKRCALGPPRRKVIGGALALYDEDTLMLAIEGCAASAWHAGENDRGTEFNDLGLIFRDEAHVERFATEGERLRERAQAMARPKAEVVAIAEPEDPAVIAARRQALRDLALRVSGRAS